MTTPIPPIRPRQAIGQVGAQEVLPTPQFYRWLEELARATDVAGVSATETATFASYPAAAGRASGAVFADYGTPAPSTYTAPDYS